MLFNYKQTENRVLNEGTFDYNQKSESQITINNLEKIGITMLDADIKEVEFNGQMIPWPEVLLDGITIPKDLDKSKSYAIYTKNEQTQKYDILNCYVYTYFNEEENKSIRMAFSYTEKPIRDYLFENKGNISTINNKELKIFQYQDIYFTEFNVEGYNFDIETENLSIEEVRLLLESIIK